MCNFKCTKDRKCQFRHVFRHDFREELSPNSCLNLSPKSHFGHHSREIIPEFMSQIFSELICEFISEVHIYVISYVITSVIMNVITFVFTIVISCVITFVITIVVTFVITCENGPPELSYYSQTWLIRPHWSQPSWPIWGKCQENFLVLSLTFFAHISPCSFHSFVYFNRGRSVPRPFWLD